MSAGLIASLITALCKAGSDVVYKWVSKSVPHDDVLTLMLRLVEALLAIAILLIGGLLFSGSLVLPVAFLNPVFWSISIASAVLSGLGLFFTFKALRTSDVSLVSPMTQLTPLILLVTSPIMIGESLTTAGVLGVVGIVFGSYAMSLGSKDNTSANPFRSFARLFSDRGVQFALLASLLYGFSSNLDKMGVLATSPVWWIAIQALMMSLPVYLWMRFSSLRSHLVLTRRQFSYSILPGITSGTGSIVQMIAISIWPVPYVIAVKRLSALVSVVSGAVLFKEENFFWRLIGALIMVLSTIAIILYG
ncbi:MAG: EamA family transporter [Patescibacteria group bacterium]